MTGPFTEADVRAAWRAENAAEISAAGANDILHLLNAAYRSAASRPDGWVACPKDRTQEQWRAARHADPLDGYTGTYCAMLAASPFALKDD